MHMASMRESRDSDRFLVNTQVQSHACTAAPRVWHFSAFYDLYVLYHQYCVFINTFYNRVSINSIVVTNAASSLEGGLYM